MTIAIRNVSTQPSLDKEDAQAPLIETLFRPMDVDGVYARTEEYERVIEGLSHFIARHREPGTEALRFPPVMSRRHLEKAGYLNSFPNLLGCVCALHGTDIDILS